MFVTLLLVVAALLVPAGASAAGAELPRLHAEPDARAGGRIADARGREVLLRGVNVNSLGDYWQGAPQPPVLPFGAEEPDEIAAVGWNVVRLIVSWSRIEPRPGVYDERYLDAVARQVARLADAGLYTIVDLHQDAWGAALAAPEGTTCTSGSPALGWDGAPAWATLDGGAERCAPGFRELSPAVQAAWAAFFADAPTPTSGGVGIRTRYVAMLRRVAQRFARSSAVAGIDVMNEPGTLTSDAPLGPFYGAALRAIRAGERAGDGFRHLVLIEPSVLWSTRGGGAPPAFARDAGVVYAPHLYGGSIGAQAPPARADFATARAEARRLGGAPVLTGEWGADPRRAEPGSDEYFLAHQALQDRFKLSATLWTWKQSCGDPHAVLAAREGAAAATPPWSLFEMDCAEGRNRVVGPHGALLADLTRGWVRRAPGRLARISWRAGDKVLLAAGTRVGRDAGELELFYPGLRPRVVVTGLTGTRVSRLGDGMVVRAEPTASRWTVQVYAR